MPEMRIKHKCALVHWLLAKDETEDEMTICGHVPFPGSGAYGHWSCQRQRFHLGSHRFHNYTTPRIPRVWDAKGIVRTFRGRRRMARMGFEKPSERKGTKLSTIRYSSVLHRPRYKPTTEHERKSTAS